MNSHQADAAVLGQRYRLIHGAMACQKAHAVVTIEMGDSTGHLADRDVGTGVHHSTPEPFDIHRDTRNTVRVDSP
jgi:hypothetical protein